MPPLCRETQSLGQQMLRAIFYHRGDKILPHDADKACRSFIVMFEVHLERIFCHGTFMSRLQLCLGWNYFYVMRAQLGSSLNFRDVRKVSGDPKLGPHGAEKCQPTRRLYT